MKSKNSLIWIPVWFAGAFIIINYVFISLFQEALTLQARETLHQDSLQFLLASSLFLFPNLILSFLLWTYAKNENPTKKQLYTLCFTAIACGFLPQIFIYALFYSIWAEGGLSIPVVMFGFPFVYLFGMMAGWVLGLWIVSYSDKEE